MTEAWPRTLRIAAALVPALLAGAGTQTRAADLPVALQLSYGEDSDFGVGARLNLRLFPNRTGAAGRLSLATSFDYFFPSEDAALQDLNVSTSYLELNENLLFALTAPRKPGIEPYLGAGVNVARAGQKVDDFSESTTEIGLNVLGGARLARGGHAFFAEARGELGGGRQVVVTAGVFF